MFSVLKKFFVSSQYEAPVMINDKIIEGREYRLPQDPPSVIRMRHDCPFADGLIFNPYVSISGLSREDRKEVVESFIMGDGRTIHLVEKEINDKEKIITVEGNWKKGKEAFSEELGTLPKAVVRDIESYSEIAATVSKIFIPHRSNSAGVRLCIWVK